jgi:NADPH-dependent ferric siderophore reductase
MSSPQLRVQRVRHETRRRIVQVDHVEVLTPKMRRVVFRGEELRDFVSAAHDDHVKLFFPRPGEERLKPSALQPGLLSGQHGEQLIARDFTPRCFNLETRTLAIDFVLHGEGPACQWAAQAEAGQWLGVGGPRSSFIVSDLLDWYLLAGDETALPAIARRLEELSASVKAVAVIEISDTAEEQPLRSSATLDLVWVHRNENATSDPSALISTVARITLPPGEGYAWVAAEAAISRRLRESLLQRGLSRECVRAAAYWKRGAVAVHETYGD